MFALFFQPRKNNTWILKKSSIIIFYACGVFLIHPISCNQTFSFYPKKINTIEDIVSLSSNFKRYFSFNYYFLKKSGILKIATFTMLLTNLCTLLRFGFWCWKFNVIVVPIFDTKVTEYLCSGWVFFSSDNFRLFN